MQETLGLLWNEELKNLKHNISSELKKKKDLG